MEVLEACCGGSDVQAKMFVACLCKAWKKDLRTFSTMPEDWLRLLDWLTQAGGTHGALESTGVSWRPVLHILAGAMDVIRTHARDAKGYTARKTDVLDAAWLADRWRHGLRKPSCIPPWPMRA